MVGGYKWSGGVGVSVESSKIGCVIEVIISYCSTSSCTLKQIKSKFKKNYQDCLIRDALKYLGPLLLKKIS